MESWVDLFQLKGLLTRSIEGWVDLFDEANISHLPILKMELVFDESKMQFYPPFFDLDELVLFIVDQIASTCQSVSHTPSPFNLTLLL